MEPSNNNANSFDKEQPINGSGDQAPASPSLITPAQVTITPNFTSTAPAQQPAQLFASDNPTQYQPLPTKGFGGGRDKKKVIFGALAALLIIGGSLGYAFGFYLPNKPANVFNTGLGRSSKAVTKLVNEFGSTEKLQKLQNSQITANADVKSSAFNVTGLLDLKLSKTKSDGSLDLKLRSGDDAQKNLSLKFLSDFPSDKQFPNLYLQVSGLSALGLGAFIPDLATYEGKWIAVDSDYLASLGSGVDTPKNKENVTSEEIAQLIKTVSATSNEYLLSSDKDKAVLVNKAFIGREKVDGIDSYHYQVVINKSNLKKFCKVLSERVTTSAAAKKFLNSDDKDAQDRKKDVDKSCDQDIDREIKDSETLDMWIDAKYKLIHKIRAYDQQDKNTYVDFGQIYNGGDTISLFVAYHQQESKVDAKFSIDLDIKKLTSKGEFVLTGKGEDDIDAKITFDAKPYTGDVKADKPSGAINIQDILQKLGYGSSDISSFSDTPAASGGLRSKAQDTERQTDIKALHAQIEAYYAQNAFYPSLANLNSATWRASNMRGLDSEALKDPEGSSSSLAATPTANQYSYATAGSCGSANQCTTYTLSTQLSTGNTYTKQNLN